MKVTLERAALLKALGHVQRVVERRTTIPILSNVLVRAAGGVLRLKATDLDLEVTEELPADVGQEGATTLPAHTLHDIVRKLPDGSQVTLDMGGDTGQLVLRSGRSRFQLQCLPESDFPDLAAGEMTHRFTLPAGQLKHLIDKTSFAISTEETRYYLNGVYLHAMEHDGVPVLRVVSTDGHRLARVEMAAPQGSAGIPGVIVPRKAVAEIQKLIEDPASDGRAVKLALSDGRLVLSVNNPDSGSATEELDVEYDASPLDIGFNARYLLDITAQLDSDTAFLKLADPGSPTLVQDREGAPALYVLMPMRV